MKWRNAFPDAKEIEIVRPLLNEPKSALREYAARNKIKFREDASNDSLDIMRNRIRHELLPLLRRAYQPALSKIVLRMMEIAGDEADLARAKAEDWIREVGHSKLARRNQPFSQLPVAVQRRCLQLQLLAEGISPDFELIEKLRLQPNTGISVERCELTVRNIYRDVDGLVQWQRSETFEFNDASCKVFLCDSAGQTTFNGLGIAWEIHAKTGMNLPKRKPGTEYFDAELVGSKVILRHWQKGDRFRPIGMPTAAKLQDLFVNQRVPRPLRHRLVVAESEKGEIFWVEGLRISERFQLTKGTKRRLQWQWRRD
jgi:tRNA(Ile)-lysidine synthase